ncbi:hypothetical protein UB46_08120, partial [Burkholderiaceae bacterium 16]
MKGFSFAALDAIVAWPSSVRLGGLVFRRNAVIGFEAGLALCASSATSMAIQRPVFQLDRSSMV